MLKILLKSGTKSISQETKTNPALKGLIVADSLTVSFTLKVHSAWIANDQVQRILRAAIIVETHPQSQIRSQNSVATTCYAAALGFAVSKRIALTALSIINVRVISF
jgi:hypothetical protein